MRNWLFILTAALLFTGCERNPIPAAAGAALESSAALELFSLEPGSTEPGSTPDAAGDTFHGWPVLGSTKLDAQSRQDVVDAFQKGVPYYDDGVRAACFVPRHGLRVLEEGKTYDFLICFQCSMADVFEDDVKVGSFLIRESPQPVFNSVLIKAGVPLAKD
jgi:hypothetical protein